MSTLKKCNSKITELITILKDETKFLKQGNFAELARLLELKNKRLLEFETLVSTLDSKGNIQFITPQIERLNRMAVNNGTLLKGAFHGVKAAQERLNKLSTQNAQLGAYDQDGEGIILGENNNLSEKHV